MKSVVVLVLVAVAMLNAQENATTLQELFVEHYGVNTHQIALIVWSNIKDELHYKIQLLLERFPVEVTPLPLTQEILQYFLSINFKIMSEFTFDLGNVALQSIYKDLNDQCGEYLETPIEDLTIETSNATCVILQLWNTLTLMLKKNIEVGLQELSGQCIQQPLPFCSRIHTNCTVPCEERLGKVLMNYVEDANEVKLPFASTPVEIIRQFMIHNVIWISKPYTNAGLSMMYLALHVATVPSIEPLTIRNLIRSNTNNDAERTFFKGHSTTNTQEHLAWGIVKTDSGSVNLPCSNYRDIYSKDSQEYLSFLHKCYTAKMLVLNYDLLNCVYTDPALRPLSWFTVPSAYFHSQCLCLAYNGTECGVKAPQGVDPRLYCLSVLLRDFQRQISYRPAVTYLDYAFKTRVPVCQLANILQIGFKSECDDPELNINLGFILSMKCYFKDLLNKDLNCSETQIVKTYNQTELCGVEQFMEYVVCDGDGDVEDRVPYYGAGYSTLVLFLTYLDVAVRVLALVTYVACSELRNLPGKLLIGYQVTALLRLLAVRATLEDLALAVRIDVSMDLASTLCLFSFLHFLTVSIMDLRPPDSLSPDEARMVLLRYALLGWALPAALSPTFFWIDVTLDSRVQFGQLLFVLCNCAVLFGNVYMVFKNCRFYYDVKTKARILQKDGKARSVFAGLFTLAMKASLLSGAGIIFRLIFTQIQGLELLLGYYHALGTLDGLLLFLLYGCNREARAFWVRCCLVNFSLASSSRE